MYSTWSPWQVWHWSACRYDSSVFHSVLLSLSMCTCVTCTVSRAFVFLFLFTVLFASVWCNMFNVMCAIVTLLIKVTHLWYFTYILVSLDFIYTSTRDIIHSTQHTNITHPPPLVNQLFQHVLQHHQWSIFSCVAYISQSGCSRDASWHNFLLLFFLNITVLLIVTTYNSTTGPSTSTVTTEYY